MSQVSILNRIRDIPSLPDVVNRIVDLMSHPNTPASEIARLISYDPGLASKVLRMVNSSAYGFQRQISSIQHGIMILGFNTVRGLVLSASIFQLFEGQKEIQGLNHVAFWEHCMATAIAARVVAKQFRVPGTEDAFSAGMLHDIGKIVLDVYFKSSYPEVLTSAKKHGITQPHGPAFIQLESSLMGTDHALIGSHLANKWKLPLTITEAIQFHHQPEQAQSAKPLVYVVGLANELARFKLADPVQIFRPEYFTPSIWDYFQLDEESCRGLLELLSEELASIEEFQQSISSAQ